MKKTLKVIVKKDGSISIDAEGFQGKGCAEAIAKFESLGRVTKSQHKSEYFKKNNFNAVLTNEN